MDTKSKLIQDITKAIAEIPEEKKKGFADFLIKTLIDLKKKKQCQA